MATTSVITPIKRRDGIFSTRFAGGVAPLTPSPSAITTPRQIVETSSSLLQTESIHRGSTLFTRLSRSSSKVHHSKDSPKSNIIRPVVQNSPRKVDLSSINDFTLTGTGSITNLNNRVTPSRLRNNKIAKSGKTRINYSTADRFIPSRSTTNESNLVITSNKVVEGSSVLANSAATTATAFDIAGHGLEDDGTLSLEGLNIIDNDDEDNHNNHKQYTKASPTTAAFQSSMATACGISLNQRILAFKPAPPESSRPIDLRSQYNRPIKNVTSTSAQFRRRVPTAPERVLDAPGLKDDYYLNLLDWSSGNQVAIGLERSVYVWSAESGNVSDLFSCDASTYISSVRWSGDGAYVAAGLATGEVQIWDVEERTKLRSMFGHDTRIGVMGWNKHLLSTGSRSGLIFNHDVRVAQHKVAELSSHTGEVCGLEWRSDGVQLATGANDNMVNIWDARSLNAPKFTKTNHRAAVKALSWCPWQNNLLATGGGSSDGMIHFWNTTSGARVNSIDTGMQVTSLKWSNTYKEIVSCSGFPENSLSIWSYPTLVKNVEIPAHDTRILYSSLSPDGQMLATAGNYHFFLLVKRLTNFLS